MKNQTQTPLIVHLALTLARLHKVIIYKFISQKYRDLHPQILKNLRSHIVQYCYSDYIEAWNKVILYQNETCSHSWLINFDNNFKSHSSHGQVLEILLEKLQDSVKYFSTVYKGNRHSAKFPTILHFYSKYKVPWIPKQHYEVQSDLVI